MRIKKIDEYGEPYFLEVDDEPEQAPAPAPKPVTPTIVQPYSKPLAPKVEGKPISYSRQKRWRLSHKAEHDQYMREYMKAYRLRLKQ